MDSVARRELFDKLDAKTFLKDKETLAWQRDTTEYLSEWMHSVFSEGKIRGEKLLDIGTGPVINSALYADPYFSKIYLSDISKSCRLFLNEWRDGKHSELLRSYFERAVKLEGSGQTPEEREEMFKSKIMDVFYCDVTQTNPLGCSSNGVGQFDAIITSWTLSSAVDNAEDFRQALKNIMSLIKPGGYLMMMNIAGTRYQYKVNDITFPIARLTDFEEIRIIESVCNKLTFRSEQFFYCEDGEIKHLFNMVAEV